MKKVVFIMSLFISMTLSAQETNSVSENNSDIELKKVENAEILDQIKKELEMVKTENDRLKMTIDQQKELHRNCKKDNHNAHDGLVSINTEGKARRQAIKGSRYRNILPPPL